MLLDRSYTECEQGNILYMTQKSLAYPSDLY